jgi:YD repeat-containing protein
MWLDRKSDWRPASTPENVPITPGHGRSRVWEGLVRALGKRLFLLACAVGVSFAFIYVETTTRLFFNLNAPRQVGDPCLALIRPALAPNQNAVWSNFGHCSVATPRDPDRETLDVDLRYGLLTYTKTEPVMMADLPWPLTRVLRNRDRYTRAFGVGGSHSYDIGLVGDAPRLTFVDLVTVSGGRVHYRPTSQSGLYDSEVGGYFEDSTLQWTGRDWRLRLDNGVDLLFPESQNATRLEQAALLGIQGEDGEPLLEIDRDRAGNIRQLRTNSGRLDFEVDARNRVTAIVEAETGRRLQFDYNAEGCLARQTDSDGVFEYDYEDRDGLCHLVRTKHNGVVYFTATYDAEGRVAALTSPAGGYTFSYVTNASGSIVRADVREPDGALRRVSLDDAGYWISHWGSYRGR